MSSSRRQKAGAGDNQLAFDALLNDAEQQHVDRQWEKAAGHLPATMEDALPFFRALLERHHAAMLAVDVEQVRRIRTEADLLAVKLNGRCRGYLATETSPGCVLRRETQSEDGTVPLWGQKGSFMLEFDTFSVRIETPGIFGGLHFDRFWLGFDAHAIDRDRPFISESGFRSFLSVGATTWPNITVDIFCRGIIDAHVRDVLKGNLVAIVDRS
jgi:hypothetical protein